MGTFDKVVNYTTHQSLFVKVSQLLVMQQAILVVEHDEVEYPADILNIMK